MRLSLHRNWTLEYLIIRPDTWERKHESDFWLRMYEVLDRRQAEWVLEEIARRDNNFLRELTSDVVFTFYTTHPAPGSHEQAREDERRLKALKRELGSVFSKRGEPPKFARFFICRRKRSAPAPQPLLDPFKKVRETIEAAKRAPRGYVSIEVVDDAGAPVPHQRLEVLLADGELMTRATDAQGQLRLDPIPRGQCHIRVPTLDGSAWHPEEGGASSMVDTGHKRVHVLQKGENLTRIAKRYGIRGWKKLWDAPDNEALRNKRKNPSLLYPGDHVVIPGIEIHQITRETDQTHRIVIGDELVEFRVVLQDHNQLPYKDEPYELRLGDDPSETPRTGSTDAKGLVVEQLAAGTPKVEVFLPKPRLRWAFELNTLLAIPAAESLNDRSDTAAQELAVEALQTRLLALGFPCGPADGVLGPRTRSALALWRPEQKAAAEPGGPAEGPQGELKHTLLAELDTKFEVVT